MAQLYILALALMVGSVAEGAGPVNGPCCEKMSVGNVPYTLVSDYPGNTRDYPGCLANCVYQKEGQPGSRFCFAEGNLPVVCLNKDVFVKEPQIDVYCEDDLKTLFDDLSTYNTSLHIKCCHDGNKKKCVGHDCYDVCSGHNITKISCVELVSEYELENKDCGKNRHSQDYFDAIATFICNTKHCPTKWQDPHCICCKSAKYNSVSKCGKECRCKAMCDYFAKSGKCDYSLSGCCECPAYSTSCPSVCPESSPGYGVSVSGSYGSDSVCPYTNCDQCKEFKPDTDDPCATWCKCNCICKYIVKNWNSSCWRDWSGCCDCAKDTDGDYNTFYHNICATKICDISLDVETPTSTPKP